MDAKVTAGLNSLENSLPASKMKCHKSAKIVFGMNNISNSTLMAI